MDSDFDEVDRDFYPNYAEFKMIEKMDKDGNTFLVAQKTGWYDIFSNIKYLTEGQQVRTNGILVREWVPFQKLKLNKRG